MRIREREEHRDSILETHSGPCNPRTSSRPPNKAKIRHMQPLLPEQYVSAQEDDPVSHVLHSPTRGATIGLAASPTSEVSSNAESSLASARQRACSNASSL